MKTVWLRTRVQDCPLGCSGWDKDIISEAWQEDKKLEEDKKQEKEYSQCIFMVCIGKTHN